MKLKSLFLIISLFIAIFTTTCYWHIFHKERRLVYAYDNTQTGGGDKVAQERVIKEFKFRGVDSALITDFLDNNIPKALSRMFDDKKYFTLLQGFTLNNKEDILSPRINNNMKYFGLLYIVNEPDKKERTYTDREICEHYYKDIPHYKKGRAISGLLITTYEYLDIDCKGLGHPIEFIQTWYPTIPQNSFIDTPATENKIFYSIGGGWDNLRSTLKYIKFLQNLAEKGEIDIYGGNKIGKDGPSAESAFKNSYKGFIDNADDFVKINQKYLASLVLHSDIHLRMKIPTGRIFEAMAAGRIIISDKNKWVMDNLKDNVLYIDIANLDEEKIAENIHNHLEWIKTHPEDAEKMAKNSHYIFLSKFSLNAQIDKLLTKME